jgi:hypothetical protein
MWMLTSVEVLNANCPSCLNDASAALMRSPGVNDVQLDSSHGCFQVEHDLPSASAITDILSRELRGWSVASNGEVEMVHTSPTLVNSCKVHLLQPRPMDATSGESVSVKKTVGETAL